MANKIKNLEWQVTENGCWECISHTKTKQGYSQIRRYNKTLKLHRWLYEELFGEIPKGLVVRHKCDNTSCINPEHLELGTQKDNIHDMLRRGAHNRAKLTKEQVYKIRLEWDMGIYEYYREIESKYNISRATVCRILTNKSWKTKIIGGN